VTVSSGTIGGVQDQSTAVISMQAEELAARHGLRRVGTRSSLGSYVRVLWSRRHSITVLATPKAYSRSQNKYLGQLWSVLNPLILAAVYLLVSGVLPGTSGNIENLVAFLTVGVFTVGFTSSSLTAGAKSITGNISLVRALHFPRAPRALWIDQGMLRRDGPAADDCTAYRSATER
jgi:teichoic acid transport system permease protein